MSPETSNDENTSKESTNLRCTLRGSEGQIIRSLSFSSRLSSSQEVCAVQVGPAKRLEFLLAGFEFDEQKTLSEKSRVPFIEVKRFQIGQLTGQLELGNGVVLSVDHEGELAKDLPLKKDESNRFVVSLGLITVLMGVFLTTILSLNLGMNKLEQELRQQVVQIIKKIPPKTTKTETQATHQSVEVKATAKASLQRMGALAVLGSLQKSGQKGGLNLGAVQTTAGPGLGGTGGSGGVQTNIYARGLAAAPLGAGGNLQGGGGYGTKGKGGGQAGYGTLSIVGSKGTSSIPLTSEASVGGGLDRDLIGAVIAKNIGQIRFCYEQGLQMDSSLHGRIAVDFTIDPNGGVKIAQIENSSLNSKQVEECVLMRLKSWKFPLPENGKEVKVSYPFVLRRTGQG